LNSQRIKHAFERLERKRSDLCSELYRWSSDQLHHRPTSESWCALEVVDHLVRTESSILGTMCRNLSAVNPISLRDRYSSLALAALMRTPVRVKVPQSAARLVAPGAVQDLGVLRKRWAAERTQLGAFVNSLTEEQRNSGIFHHPVGGWTDAIGTLAFIDAHLAHHRFQIHRIEKDWQRRPQRQERLVGSG
jgi:hypothetical protein